MVCFNEVWTNSTSRWDSIVWKFCSRLRSWFLDALKRPSCSRRRGLPLIFYQTSPLKWAFWVMSGNQSSAVLRECRKRLKSNTLLKTRPASKWTKSRWSSKYLFRFGRKLHSWEAPASCISDAAARQSRYWRSIHRRHHPNGGQPARFDCRRTMALPC